MHQSSVFHGLSEKCRTPFNSNFPWFVWKFPNFQWKFSSFPIEFPIDPEEQLALQNDVLIGKVLSKQHTNNSWIKLIASKNIICPSIDGENVYSGYYGIYNIYTLLNNLTKLTIAYTHPLLVLPQPRTQNKRHCRGRYLYLGAAAPDGGIPGMPGMPGIWARMIV